MSWTTMLIAAINQTCVVVAQVSKTTKMVH